MNDASGSAGRAPTDTAWTAMTARSNHTSLGVRWIERYGTDHAEANVIPFRWQSALRARA